MATQVRASEAPPAYNCLVLKLSGPVELSQDDEAAIKDLCREVHAFSARRDIVREGDKPEHVHVVLEGWAARYKLLRDGRRQITAFLVPGDVCDMHVTILGEMDHSILALTDSKIAFVAHEAIQELTQQRPALVRALWRATLVDEAVLRDWIVNIGRRDAETRIAHLFCELHARLKLIGLAENGHFRFPLTQDIIADAVGLTPVHVNRMLQRLRAEELIDLSRGELTILNLARLQGLAGFDPTYLHLGKPAVKLNCPQWAGRGHTEAN